MSPKIKFKVDSEWKPTKNYIVEVDDFCQSIIDTASDLLPGQSFPIPTLELKNKYNWEPKGTCASSIRHLLKREMKESLYSTLSIHEVKNGDKVTHIRIRKRNS